MWYNKSKRRLDGVDTMLPYSIDEIRRRVVPVAKKYQLATVFLFGSYARGEATVDSDVDLLIDLTNSTVHGFVLGGLYNDLEEALGVSVDLVSVASLEQPGGFPSDRLLRENIDREKIMIYAPT